MTPQSTPEEAQYKRPDASMSLLINIMDHSLDEGYAEATARRAVRGEAGVISRAPGARLLVAVGVGLIAVVVTMAAMQVRAAAPQAEKERQDLISRIHTREADADKRQKEVEALRDQLDELQDKNLTPDEAKRVRQLAMITGAEAVEGPGVKVEVDDAEQSSDTDGANKDPRQQAESLTNGRVLDRDLQRVVNGLWAAGAEAIGINGQRLTGLSAIRAAGASILVDNRPLSPPYTVLAIGDRKKMQVDFQDGPDGRYLHALGERYGIRATIGTQKKIKLPAAIGMTLRVAQAEGTTPQGGGPIAPRQTPQNTPQHTPSATPGPGTSSGPAPGAGTGTVSPSAGATGTRTSAATPSRPVVPTRSTQNGTPASGAGSGAPSNTAAARYPAPAHEEGQA